MAHTVKDLAALSGVSIRTLRWYDQKGLLTPAYYGENGYRYYEEEQFLQLQQILFLRELGFTLQEIKKIINGSRFDRLQALVAQKRTLQESLKRTTQLLETIEKTIGHLKGEQQMSLHEVFEGFDLNKQKRYEEELKQILAEKKIEGTDALFEESQNRTRHWGKKEWQAYKDQGAQINQALTEALKQGRLPGSSTVQELIAQHYAMIEQFYTPTKEIYSGLGDLYCEHPDFREFYAKVHPDLAPFLREAMHIYADENL